MNDEEAAASAFQRSNSVDPRSVATVAAKASPVLNSLLV